MKETYQLDAVDRRILAALQEDASISHAALAERVGASTASCWRRIKALETAGVLTRTVRLVDAGKVGRGVNVLCHIRMRSHTAEGVEAFESFVRSRPEILECYSMSGDWDYLLHIVAQDVADYERVLMHGILDHEAIASSSSIFVLRRVKHTTAIPV